MCGWVLVTDSVGAFIFREITWSSGMDFGPEGDGANGKEGGQTDRTGKRREFHMMTTVNMSLGF